jgi:hypothetical protein
MGKIIQAYTSVEKSFGAGANANSPICQVLRSLAAGTPPLGLVSLKVQLTNPTPSTVALVQQATRGTATTSLSALAVSSESGVAVTGTVATAWLVTPPTRAAYAFRTEYLGAQGAEFEWTWPEDDPFTDPVLLWNPDLALATGSLQITARWMEFLAL